MITLFAVAVAIAPPEPPSPITAATFGTPSRRHFCVERAIATATANRVLMLEHAIYTVISPEGAASILWRDSGRAQDAATGMKITAEDLMRFGVIDAIVPEPVGGAHREPQETIRATGDAVESALSALDNLPPEDVRRQRREKFLANGRTL